jgi:flavin reductase (DIM6/NTAB) family NADH-FMN oxidoreductase RutF
VHRDNRALEILLGNGSFVANVLGDDQEHVAKTFAGLVPELRDDRFACGTWRRLTTGAPALAGALANFDCRIASTHDYGTHRILIGEVVDLAGGAGDPLLFVDRTFRRLAAA